MAMKMEDLRKLLDAEGLRYYLDPNRDAALLGFGGVDEQLEIVIALDVEGRFLQFRSMNYSTCKADHPHLPAVLRLLAQLNLSLRLVKYAWDQRDGEIMVFADVWLMDAALTAEQFKRMLHNIVSSMDENLPRIRQTIESGKDPGPEDPAALAAKAGADPSSLPEPLRKLVEKIRGKKDEPKASEKAKTGPEVGEL